MRENIVEEIRILHQLGAAMETSASVGTILNAAAEAVARLLPSDRVTLIEINLETRRVGFFARGGIGSSEISTSVGFDELEQGLSGWVLQHGKSALSHKGAPDERESVAVYHRRLETNCGAIIVVPLRVGESTLGTMTAINGIEAPDFSPQDVELMEMFADYCAIVIQNARNFIQLKDANQEVASLNSTLRRSNSMKDNLFTILAHDLRGPVGNMAMIMDMITDQLAVEGDLGKLLELGRQSSHQTYNLLENLLSWVRSQMEGVEQLRVPVLIGTAMENVTGWLGPQASKKGIQIFCDCPKNLRLQTDQSTIETIVRNLVSNAIKYSAVESKILIRVRSECTQVVIEVEDFGPGIDPEKLGKLFFRNKMDSQPGTAGEMGNGLGLMFCSDLATSIEGRLEAENKVVKGSVFRLILSTVKEGNPEEGNHPGQP